MRKVNPSSILDEPLFTVTQAAMAAAAMPLNTLRSWLQLGVISLHGTDASAPAGGTRKLSLRRCVQIAIARELVEVGEKPQRAGRFAFAFSDQVTAGGMDNDGTERLAGYLYPRFDTWLVTHPDAAEARVVWVKPTTRAALLCADPDGVVIRAGTFVPLNPIVGRVYEMLGLIDEDVRAL